MGLDPLIGTWRTTGAILGDDGEPVGQVDGTDAYEWLGRSFVIHRVDVKMGDDPVRALEIIGPYDEEAGAFATRAYDDQGGEEVSTASADGERAWTFRSTGAQAKLEMDDDGRSMRAEWVRTDDGGATWVPWMHLTLNRVS
jgi:hypothetical protein